MAEDPFIQRAQQLALNMLRRAGVRRAASYKRVFALALPPGADPATIARARDVEIVLADLRDQAFAQKSTFHADPYEAAKRQGKREIWLRIVQHLNLDEERVQKLVELEDDEF
jgi:hypothetical protein